MFIFSDVGWYLERFFQFVQRNLLQLIVVGFGFLVFCWAVGYFANALYGYKFELASCWAGFGAIGGAGVLATIKYCMDSWKNSPEDEMPAVYKPKERKPGLFQKAANTIQDFVDDGKLNGSNKVEVNIEVEGEDLHEQKETGGTPVE